MIRSFYRNKLLFCLILFLNCSLFSQGRSIAWSSDQYYLNWNEAEALCRKQGKRLPDYREIKSAYKSKITDQWIEEIDRDIIERPSFWYSTNDKTNGYILPVFIPDEGVQMSVDKTTKRLLRCIRDLEMEKRIKLSKPFANWSSYQ